MQQTSTSLSPVEAKCIEQPVLQHRVFVSLRGSTKKIYQARGSLLVEGHNDIIVLSVVSYYCAEVKLCLDLSELELWLGCPEGWKL